MTDLTEQWKKGELPDGTYYITDKRGIMYIDYFADVWDSVDVDEVKDVLAPVPSYDDYVSLKKFMVGGINAVNSIRELEAEIKEKETQRIRLMLKLNDVNNENHSLRIENEKLKELLKECREPLEVLADKRDACDWYPEILLAKIDEALK